MVLKVYNTLTRKKEDFLPINPPKAGVYTCGPTVYHYAHIGNLRSYVFADILRRVLEYNKYEVTHLINITDVGHLTDDADSGEDKMEKGAAREGKDVWEIAEYYTEAFMKDMKALNILEPTRWPKATDHIQEQIDQIKLLEEKGVTYRTDDGIYFDTSKIEDYGKLVPGFTADNLEGGSRVALGDKKHKTDFALWKFSPEGEKRQMEWDSPWGVGFPGWHIECTAMGSKYLGEQFDIHTGGIDHVPIHHTNEIAQAETAYGKKPYVKYWMHGEFLVLDKGEKMAKSDDNFLTLDKLQEDGYKPLVYRYFLLTAHYRQQLAFSTEGMDGARASYERLRNIVKQLHKEQTDNHPASPEYLERFQAAINDDLNMPKALAVLWDVLRDKELPACTKLATAAQMDRVLGLGVLDVEEEEIPVDIRKFADERQAAREGKEWEKADAMREVLKEKGWEVRDNKEGYELKKL